MSRIVTHNDNFPCIGCDETDFHLASTTWSSNFTSTSNVYNNLKTVASSASYARINVDKTASSTSYFYALFDFSVIPNGATITNTIGKIRLYSSGNQASNRNIRWCVGDINTPVSNTYNYSTSSNPVAITLEPLQHGISVQDLKNVKCYVRYVRSKYTDSQRYIYMYGADVTVDWEETLYAISISSSVQGVGISAQDSETTSGDTNIITVTGISVLSDIKLMDNGTDVTSSLVKSGSNYTYTLSNIQEDHNILLVDNILYKKSYHKSTSWIENTGVYKKVESLWQKIEYTNIYVHDGLDWIENDQREIQTNGTLFDIQ